MRDAHYFQDGAVFAMAGHASPVLTAIHTPGHTPDSTTFYDAADGLAFVGDNIFKGGMLQCIAVWELFFLPAFSFVSLSQSIILLLTSMFSGVPRNRQPCQLEIVFTPAAQRLHNGYERLPELRQ